MNINFYMLVMHLFFTIIEAGFSVRSLKRKYSLDAIYPMPPSTWAFQ